MEDDIFEITMELADGYKFLVDFQTEGVSSLVVDEPPPLGEGDRPNAARLLAAAVGNCLSASALYCLRRARIDVNGMSTRAQSTLARNERGRLRVAAIKVEIEPEVAQQDVARMRRCLEIFEDFCVVTASVRGGIDVEAEVRPRAVSPALTLG